MGARDYAVHAETLISRHLPKIHLVKSLNEARWSGEVENEAGVVVGEE